MAGELKQKQFIDNEVKPLIRNTIPDILKRLSVLEALVEPKVDTKAKTESLKDYVGGDEGVRAIKESKTLVEAIDKVKKVKAKKK